MLKKATIEKPCSENWEAMKIGLHSRFCCQCTRDVIDFRNMERKQILEYLLMNYDKKICGRLYPSQLDFSHSDFIITIKSLESQSKNSNLAFYLLTIGSLFLASCNEISDNGTTVNDYNFPIFNSSFDSNSIPFKLKNDQKVLENFQQLKLEIIDTEEIPVMGEVEISDCSLNSEDASIIYTAVEVMPEFKGGVDSLMSFIQRQTRYPEWEKKNKIQGIVYASFVVDKNGNILNPTIIKSVDQANNFDSEVIRVINSMPNWIPGKQGGINVNVSMNIPFRFEL